MKKINAARVKIDQSQQRKKTDTYQSSDINTAQSKQLLQDKRKMYNNNPPLDLFKTKEYLCVERSTQYSPSKKEANVLNYRKRPPSSQRQHWQTSVMGPGKQMTIANLGVKNEVSKNEVSKLSQQFNRPTLQQYLLGNNGCLPIHSLQARTMRGQPLFCL
jgi:hypothetical protein